MKKVEGCITVRALGTHHFEFFVDDDATDSEIDAKVEAVCNYYIDYAVEEGYEEYTKGD